MSEKWFGGWLVGLLMGVGLVTGVMLATSSVHPLDEDVCVRWDTATGACVETTTWQDLIDEARKESAP